MNQDSNNFNQNNNGFNSNLQNEPFNKQPINNNERDNNPLLGEAPMNPLVNREPTNSESPNLNVSNSSFGSNQGINVMPEQNVTNQDNLGPKPITQPIPPQNNSFNFSSPNNDGNNFTPLKKKNSSILIAIIIVFVVIVAGVGIGVFFNKNNSNSGTENSNNTGSQSNGIKQIEINSKSIVALDSNGNLYYIGDDDISRHIYKDNENHNTVKRIASNVEKFKLGLALYYIDNKHDLYFLGDSYNGGGSKEFTKDEETVSDVNVYMNLCGYIIRDNKELYVKNSKFTVSDCGLNKEYDEFTKIASNVKETIINMNYGGYITDSNELYFSKSNSNFVKLLDNVKSVISVGYFQLLILTNDNKLYVYTKGETDYTLTLLKEDVSELGPYSFKTTNGEYHLFSNHNNLIFIKGEASTLYREDSRIIYSGVINATDINKVLYYANANYLIGGYQKILIYLSNNGKIVILDENGKKEMDYNINNLEKIYELAKSKDD